MGFGDVHTCQATLVNEFGHRKSETKWPFSCKEWEESHRFSKTSLLLMEQLPVLNENHFCNWSWRHHLVLTFIYAKKKRKNSIQALVCVLNLFSDCQISKQIWWLTWFGCITPRQRHSWPRYCNLPASLLLSEGVCHWSTADWLTVWTLLPLPGAWMDQMQQPRKEEGEESGEAVLLWLGGRVWANGVSGQW